MILILRDAGVISITGGGNNCKYAPQCETTIMHLDELW